MSEKFYRLHKLNQKYRQLAMTWMVIEIDISLVNLKQSDHYALTPGRKRKERLFLLGQARYMDGGQYLHGQAKTM
jgi:hypothetical protein